MRHSSPGRNSAIASTHLILADIIIATSVTSCSILSPF